MNKIFKNHLNLCVLGFIIANCIRLRVTSKGYEKLCAIAPAIPPQSNFAGNVKTNPPKQIIKNKNCN